MFVKLLKQEQPMYGLSELFTLFLLITFFQLGIPYSQLAIGHQIEVSSSKATARQPDLIIQYWIVDPDEAVVKVGKLNQGVYQFLAFSGQQVLVSPTFQAVNLTAQQVLSAGA